MGAVFAEGFHEAVAFVELEAGGFGASGELTNPSATAKDYFQFAFDVRGRGAVLSGFSLEVQGAPMLSFEVTLHDARGTEMEKLLPRSPTPETLSWRGGGTLAGAESLGIRLAPDSYRVRIAGMNAKERKRLTIDNVKLVFEEL